MTNVTKFRYPEKQATDPLLRSDPMPDFLKLTPDARLIYLKIIDESDPGVLLGCDQLAVGLAAMQTSRLMEAARLLPGVVGEGELDSLAELYSSLLLPDLGQEYTHQILNTG